MRSPKAVKGVQRRFNVQQLVAADHFALHTKFLHDGSGACRTVKRFLVGVVVGDTAFQPVVFDAGLGHHVFQGRVAVRAQRHQLRHVAFKRGVVALAQKLQTPAPLGGVERLAHGSQ